MLDKGYKRPTAKSRELRANMTDAERRLWSHLSARKVGGVRFNSQFPIGAYVCDFVSRGAKLVIEVDGGQHAQAGSYDEARTRFIEARGYRVIRFWNNDVLANVDGVVAEIERVLADMPSPSPSRKREGSSFDVRPASISPPASREGSGEGLSSPPTSRPRHQ